jgi:hypothetical protein
LQEDGTIQVTFEEGEPTVVGRQQAQMVFGMLIRNVLDNPEVKQNVQLKVILFYFV